MRGMVREYTASRDQGGASLRGLRLAVGSSVADGAVRPGVEWLAVGPARLNVSQGQRRCDGERAERVIRPAREKNRRRRVLVVTTWTGPRCGPGYANLYRQPGGVGGDDGMWFTTPHTSGSWLSTSAWPVVGLQLRVSPSRL